ncbi:hypothetical protein AU385_10750 [Bacillus halotolerans]|uniref:hypothetical protein n=1 Tax=Bacillus halotolerans TaxID=260554 RepID=UPI000750058B|nr:hypothetical protein [Bacillus halotolerans]KUP33848.1 hypothetical protein AU385_10750 [Bacillus halotolerans]
MNKEIKETIAESLLEILPPLTNAVNDMINATKDAGSSKKNSKELLYKVGKLSIHTKKFMAPVRPYLDLDLNKSELALFETWITALENLNESVEIFLYLIQKETEDEEISTDKKGYELDDAVNYLFEASRNIGDLVDSLYN